MAWQPRQSKEEFRFKEKKKQSAGAEKGKQDRRERRDKKKEKTVERGGKRTKNKRTLSIVRTSFPQQYTPRAPTPTCFFVSHSLFPYLSRFSRYKLSKPSSSRANRNGPNQNSPTNPLATARIHNTLSSEHQSSYETPKQIDHLLHQSTNQPINPSINRTNQATKQSTHQLIN